jgi:D-alanyl-lipoteichoic acid acyltransferase DltB (MBOAT superfamily)
VNFNSLEFVAFLLVALGAYWATRGTMRRLVLLAVSWRFYALWDLRFLGIVVAFTAVTYLVALRIEGARSTRERNRWLALGVGADLVALGFFKYFDFFVDSGRRLAEGFGFDGTGPAIEILLPIAISFYTFESISYLVDVWRGRHPATRDPVTVALFLSYFPKALAGPIERADHLFPQLRCEGGPPGVDGTLSAVRLIVLGLFQKVVLADLAAPVANQVFDAPGDQSALVLVLGVYAFAVQIYGDFAGYTNIARGVSRLFGIELVHNFREPYLSGDPAAFWRRWHISLSTWLRDYLYIPLGGNRGSAAATYRNLMITMLLGGLWHGASWTFVVWGGLHGCYLVAYRVLGVGSTAAGPRAVVRTVVFFQWVCVAWVFFRAESFATALDVLGGIVSLQAGEWLREAWIVPVLLVASFAMDLALRRVGYDRALDRRTPVLQGAIVGCLLVGVLVASGQPSEPFIYFQF